MDRAAFANLGVLGLRSDGLAVVVEAFGKKRSVITRRDPRQQSIERRPDIANHTDIDRMAAAKMRTIKIDLEDGRLLGIILPPSEIAAEKNQHIARHQCVIA